jgi:hypothetical protein
LSGACSFISSEDGDSSFAQNIGKYPSKYRGLYLIRKDFAILHTSLAFAIDYLRYKSPLATHHASLFEEQKLISRFVSLKIITKLQLFKNKCEGR